MINNISSAIVPLLILTIIIFGQIKKVNIFDCFTDGAKEGLQTAVSVLPSLIALVCAISMLRASGVTDAVATLLSPILDLISFPKELVPLALMRPISGSGALAVINDLLSKYGADSFIGRCASVIAGSTETTFYTLAVYLGSVGITNSRYTVKSALAADFAAMLSGIFLVRLFFY